MAENMSPADEMSARTDGAGPVPEKSRSWTGWITRIVAVIAAVPAIVGGTWVIVMLTTLVFDRQSLELDTLSVPKALVDEGFTPEVATQHLRDAILVVQDSANTYMRKASVEEPGVLDVVIPDTGLSLKSFAATIRSLIPSWRHEISGEFTGSGTNLVLRVRMNGRVMFTGAAGPISTNSAERLIANGVQGAAFAVVRRTQPYVAAVFLFDKGDLAGAESALQGIPRGDENWFWAQSLIGSIIYQRGGECTMAKGYFDKASKLSVAQGDLAALFGDPDCEYYDPNKSIQYYKAALKLNKKMEEAYTGLGNALINRNDNANALKEYKTAIMMNPLDPSAHLGIGEILQDRGDIDGALSEYDKARDIDLQLIQQDDAVRTWQSSLASADRSSGLALSSEDKVEFLDKAQSKLALAMSIDQALSNQDNLNAAFKAHWAEDERYLGNVQAKLWALYETPANCADAAKLYQKAETDFREAELIDTSISVGRYNLRWRRDLSSDLREEGLLALSKDDKSSALDSFERAKSVDTFFNEKPTNSLWPIYLATDDGYIGTVFAAEQKWPSALSAYQNAQSIAQTLARKDPGNQSFQQDVLTYGLDTGDMFRKTNNVTGALAQYHGVNAAAMGLSIHDKSNVFWQQELSNSYSSISGVLKDEGKFSAALQASSDARKVDQALVKLQGSEGKWKFFVVWDDRDMGALLTLLHNLTGALSAYRDAQLTDQTMIKIASGPAEKDWLQNFAEDTASINALSRLANK